MRWLMEQNGWKKYEKEHEKAIGFQLFEKIVSFVGSVFISQRLSYHQILWDCCCMHLNQIYKT